MIALIAAVAKDMAIGKDNMIPWKNREERRLFMELTRGKTVIMGRRTFDSIGKPLRGRRNIVLSKTSARIDGVDVCSSLDEAFAKARSYGSDAFVIGGAEVFAQAMPYADKMYISYINEDIRGDAKFPGFSRDEWNVEKSEDFAGFRHVVYVRKNAMP